MNNQELELEELVSQLLDLNEAYLVASKIAFDVGLKFGPSLAGLKDAAKHGRLEARLKGRVYFTTKKDVREYVLRRFDPHNRAGNKPVKDPGAAKRKQRQRAKPVG